jgi:hypothetical protein
MQKIVAGWLFENIGTMAAGVSFQKAKLLQNGGFFFLDPLSP